MSNEAPEDARRPITEELLEHEGHSYRLKTEWNTYAPISKIPDEILIEILEAARKLLIYSAWYQLLGVCSHWRNVAVGKLTWWQRPPTHKHGLTLVMLQRTKNAVVDVEITNRTSLTTVVDLCNHIGRFRVLDIQQSEAPSLRRTLECLLDSHQEFSRLEALSIWPQISGTESLVIPAIPFHQSRTVHTIQFININFDWNMFPCPNLTALILLNNHHTRQIPADHLLLILSQMPNLKNIQLDVDPILLRDIPVSSNSVVRLPLLLRLELRAVPVSLAQYLLSHLRLPSLKVIAISFLQSPERAYNNHSGIEQAVSSIIRNGKSGLLNRLSVDYDGFQIEQDWDTRTVWGDQTAIGFYNLLGHNTSANTLLHFKFMHSILRRLHQLTLGCDVSLDLFVLLQLCEIMISVEKIVVAGGPTALPTLIKAFEARQSPDMLFPELKTIQLENYDFDDNIEILQALCDILIKRKEYGLPVHKVYVPECDISRDNLNRLREIVEDVHRR